MEKWLPHTSWSGRRRTDFQRGALPMQVTINTEKQKRKSPEFLETHSLPFDGCGRAAAPFSGRNDFPGRFFHAGSCHDAQCGLPAGIPSGTGRLPRRDDWKRMFFPCVRRISCGQRPENSIIDPENQWNERPASPNLPRAEYVSPCAGKQYFACSVLPMS